MHYDTGMIINKQEIIILISMSNYMSTTWRSREMVKNKEFAITDD